LSPLRTILLGRSQFYWNTYFCIVHPAVYADEIKVYESASVCFTLSLTGPEISLYVLMDLVQVICGHTQSILKRE